MLLIFSDLDATLLDHNTYSFQEALPALQLIRKRKIPLILSSSKTYDEMIVIRKELNNLSSAGYLKKEQKNNKVIYSANIEHPMFNIIRKVVLSHLGIQDIVNNILDSKSKNSELVSFLINIIIYPTISFICNWIKRENIDTWINPKNSVY